MQQNRDHYQNSKHEKDYIGNVNKDVKEQDLIKLFGFNATSYFRENCQKMGKIKALALQ